MVGNLKKSIMLLPSAFCFLPLILIIVLSGCAYFNTFYMAQKAFNDAERQRKRDNMTVTQTNTTKYKNAIESAAEVVRDYPKSKYVDNSLYIIGVSYFRRKEYDLALNKCDEILAAFPNGEFAQEAKHYKALCLIETNKYEDASIILNDIIATGTRSMKGRAGLALVDIALRDEAETRGSTSLLNAAQNVIDSDPEKEELYQAMAYKGEALFNLERYEESIAAMEALLKNKVSKELKLKGNLQIALAKAKLGQYDESLNYLDRMQARGEFAMYAPSIRLKMGNIYEWMGDDEKADDTYRKLAGDFQDSLSSKEAWYRVGIIQLKDLSKADAAKEAFENVGKNRATTIAAWVDSTKNFITTIDMLKKRIAAIEEAKSDSLKKAQARFNLAELYTFSFDRPDSALTQYKMIVEEAPQTDYAVRSEYFIGLDTLRSENRFSEETDHELMESIVKKYPDSPFSQELKVQLGLIENPPEVKAFMQAEHARISEEKPDVYMPMYRAVADSFSATKAGCKALFVMAYFYEHAVGDTAKATELYTELSNMKDAVAGKEYVQLAMDKLEMMKNETDLIKGIEKSIAYLIYDRTKTADSGDRIQETGDRSQETVISSQEPELTGFRKIRAQNARIRSRYYQN